MDLKRIVLRIQFERRVSVGLCSLCLIALMVSACGGDQSSKYSISVEYLSFQLDESVPDDSVDYSSALVSVKRVDINESNEEVLSELKKSPLRSGKVKLRGHIEQPMWVEVVVETDKAAETLSTRTFVEPGESVALAVIDTDLQFYDAVGHVGTLSNVQDQNKKFSVKADLKSLSFDMHHAFAFLETRRWDEKGARRWKAHSFIVVQDGEFRIELEVEDPEIVSVYIESSPSYYSSATFIAEPGATILLEPSIHSAHTSTNLTTGWFQDRQIPSQRSQIQELTVTDGTGRRERLFGSWRNSFTYRLKQELLDDAAAEDQAVRSELEAMRPSLEEADDGQSEDSTSNLEGVSWVKADPAEGCEHVELSQALPDIRTRSTFRAGPKVSELRAELDSMQLTTLNDIARRARDPFDSLLAVELGAFRTTEQRQELIKVLEKLSQQVSDTVVEKRIAPMLKFRLSVIESEENEHLTLPGQKAPDFELSDLRGTSQRISQIFESNNLVYMTFVRNSEYYLLSELVAKLHNVYSGSGLQIVEVLFKVNSEIRQKLASNQEVEWMQLLDPQIYSSSDVAKSYAVVHRHFDYLIDSNGCIVQRNIGMEDLTAFLDSYFDIP